MRRSDNSRPPYSCRAEPGAMRIGVTMLTSLSVNANATVQRAEEMKRFQQGVAPYVAQGATKVNADVRHDNELKHEHYKQTVG